MSNIIKFPGLYHGDLSAAYMLRKIADEEPQNAFLIVWPKDGGLPTYHSSTGDTPVILMRIQQFIHKLFSGEFGETK